jgi:sugar lactone lactonase YvrE
MNHTITTLLAALALIVTARGQAFPPDPVPDLVLGQTSFTSSVIASPYTASSLVMPAAVVVDPVTRKVFVIDAYRRILRYPSAAALTSGAAAEQVFRQSNFSENLNLGVGGCDAYGLCLDTKGRLWVADTGNHRVLMFEAANTRTSSVPDKVLGQSNFTTRENDVNRFRMAFPLGVCVDSSDRLWVADNENGRVLRFDDVTNKPNGALADGVLGKPDFVTGGATYIGALSSSNLASAHSVTISPTGALFVADGAGNRVLRFDNAATLANGSAATAVLGQADFTTKLIVSPPTAATMLYPVSVFSTPGDTLWVTDSSNSRVLRLDSASTKPTNSAANGVIGQPNFTTIGIGMLAINRFRAALGLCVDSVGSLWLADTENHRVLRFSPTGPVINPPITPPIVTPPATDTTPPEIRFNRTNPKSTKQASVTLKGSASDASGVKSVQYRLGKGPLKLAKGTTVWALKAKLKKGKNTLILTATDTAGNVSVGQVLKITRK